MSLRAAVFALGGEAISFRIVTSLKHEIASSEKHPPRNDDEFYKFSICTGSI